VQVGHERWREELVWEWDEEEGDFHDTFTRVRLILGFDSIFDSDSWLIVRLIASLCTTPRCIA